MIEGSFPDLTPVIPKTYTTRAVLPTDEFRKACRTADIFARESSNTARVAVEPGDGLSAAYATVAANSKETGDNVAQVDASVEGMPIEIAFNSEYLLDALDVIETEGVQIQLSGQLDPAVVRPVDQDDYLCVLMPMQLKEEVLPA